MYILYIYIYIYIYTHTHTAGDILVSVDSREVQGLSVRDVQKLFTGEPSTYITIVGYSTKRGSYTVVLLRGGGGGSNADLCAEVCSAASRMHDEIDRMKLATQEGQDESVKLKAELEVVKTQAEDAKRE